MIFVDHTDALRSNIKNHLKFPFAELNLFSKGLYIGYTLCFIQKSITSSPESGAKKNFKIEGRKLDPGYSRIQFKV